MLQHCRKVLDKWNDETRENKLRTARELLVCSHSARTREDLVFKSWLSSYLQTLREFNQYGDFDDPELAIAVARSCVNIASSDETHLFFIHEANRALHLRLFREPWIGLSKGEQMLPEPVEWVFHLSNLATHEEAPRLGLAIILNLTTTPHLAEVVFAKRGLDLLIDRLASQDVAVQRMAAAAIWNLSKYPEIMGGITRFLSVSDTLERLAAKGVPMKRPPASVLMEALPSVLEEATVNLGNLDCKLGGEPYFALGVKLASTGTTMMVLKPIDRDGETDTSKLSRVKITITNNPQITREEALRRLKARRKIRAETERRLIEKAAARMSFQEVRDDLTAFGLDVEEWFDREAMNAELVDLLLSDTTRESLGLPPRRPDEAAAERDAFAKTTTIKDSTEKGLKARPMRKS